MAGKVSKLGFNDLVRKVRTKFQIPNIWFVTLNVKDAALLLWRETKKDPEFLGIWLALSSGIFGVLPKDVVHYLPYPELAAKTPVRPSTAEVELSEDEDDAIAEDIRESKAHDAERWAAAKKSHADKGKAVAVEKPKKKHVSRPKEKLLGASINTKRAKLNRDTQKDSKTRPRESVTPTPPLKPKAPIKEWSS
ncbi:hypothetical protein R1sor_007665 [Riccia sorocarpa]|uniref:Uncharacterized protein n=1 Tax=Riccia sorocarpa TaxID=122646 RepID=A0ABD3HTL4_9MARC